MPHLGPCYEPGSAWDDGEPGEDGNNGRPEGGIAAFLQQDGAYSEFVHKARFGIPDTVMSRAILGEPNSQDMIDVMLYLQEYIAQTSDFDITGGIGGTWYLAARDGEGFKSRWSNFNSDCAVDGMEPGVSVSSNSSVVASSNGSRPRSIPIWR